MENELKSISLLLRDFKDIDNVLKKRLSEKQEKALAAQDRTFELIEKMASSIAHVQEKAVRVRRRFRVTVEFREALCFIAFLYFDIKSQTLADMLDIDRQVVHHYCQSVINKYQIYSEFKNSILGFFTEEDVEGMIEKFQKKKRNMKGNGKKNGKRQIEKVC
jgi:hypothetical protein